MSSTKVATSFENTVKETPPYDRGTLQKFAGSFLQPIDPCHEYIVYRVRNDHGVYLLGDLKRTVPPYDCSLIDQGAGHFFDEKRFPPARSPI